ncbi:MAG TPA: flagellar hook-basal body complex protein [Phycisphaerales bacterium]|nr:flagellar hook-basal body complex protein [Phycisphaerales bacterium]
MGSTVALLTGLTGLNANSRNLEVIGNNIANVNTTAFKSSRMLFSTAMQRTLDIGSAPADESGGTNPTQIGMGVKVAGTQHDFSQGSFQTTGDGRDLAIEGDGFFVVQRGEDRFYTRAGAFRQDAAGNLVTLDGDLVLGYAADDDFNIVDGVLTGINIPLGARAVAEATENVRVVGNLNAAGELPAGGSVISLGATGLTGFVVLPGASNPPGAGAMIENDSLLVEIEDPEAPGLAMFRPGQTLRIDGARKGGAGLPPAELAIGADTTISDLLAFFNQALGLHATGANPDGLTPGARAATNTGNISLVGNIGAVNDLELPSGAVRLLDADGSLARLPFVSTKSQDATGESVRTTFITYDSLGQEVAVDISFAIERKGDTGTTWRYFLESADDTDLDLRLGTGEIDFDTSGLLLSGQSVPVVLDRAGTGAASPLAFDLAFAGAGEQLTALADDPSSVASTFRDGRPSGTLEDFGIDREGLITGVFSNGLTRTLGRVVVAKFTNNDGLVEEGSNLFRQGPNSGDAAIVTPTTFGSGAIVSGALEQANVDLGQEFIKMIMSSTGYSASSRVVRTADELLEQLLVIGR